MCDLDSTRFHGHSSCEKLSQKIVITSFPIYKEYGYERLMRTDWLEYRIPFVSLFVSTKG